MKRICLFLFLAGCVSADYIVQVNDINTMNPLDAVNISMYNDTDFVSWGVTDLSGIYVFNSSYVLPFSLNMSKHGYFDFGVYVDNGSILNVYLIPVSSTGIIRIHTVNIGLHSSDKFCVYFQENMRIKDCYSVGNGTSLVLLVNRNYTIIPDLNNADIITGASNFQKFSYLFIPALESGGFILGVLALVYFIIFRRH